MDAADSSKVTASISCGGSLEGTALAFYYSVHQFKNGNVFAAGWVNGTISAEDGLQLLQPGAEWIH
jgi:hypothetical protein